MPKCVHLHQGTGHMCKNRLQATLLLPLSKEEHARRSCWLNAGTHACQSRKILVAGKERGRQINHWANSIIKKWRTVKLCSKADIAPLGVKHRNSSAKEEDWKAMAQIVSKAWISGINCCLSKSMFMFMAKVKYENKQVWVISPLDFEGPREEAVM